VKQVKQLLHWKSEADKLIFWGKRAKKIRNIRGCFTRNYTVPTPLLNQNNQKLQAKTYKTYYTV